MGLIQIPLDEGLGAALSPGVRGRLPVRTGRLAWARRVCVVPA
jgi:hypothetical protein